MKRLIGIALTFLICIASFSLAACSDNSTSYLEDRVRELETLVENQNELIEDLSDKLDKTNNLLDNNRNDIIKLTTENYDRYISVNLYYDNCLCEATDSGYNLYCMGNILTAPKTDCTFSDVSIKYKIDVIGWATNPVTTYVELSYIGESHGSFFASRLNSSSISFPNSYHYNITVEEIYGVVLVPKLP